MGSHSRSAEEGLMITEENETEMRNYSLTANTIERICKDRLIGGQGEKPIVQVVGFTFAPPGGRNQKGGINKLERCAFHISDGIYFQYVMIPPSKNHLVHSGTIQIGSIVRLNKFHLRNFTLPERPLSRKMIIVTTSFSVLGKSHLIGEPRVFLIFPDYFRPLVDCGYIGREYDLRGGWPLQTVARGIVEDVNPTAKLGEKALGRGNFRVYVNFVFDPSIELPSPHDQSISKLGHIEKGSLIWPKSLLVPCLKL